MLRKIRIGEYHSSDLTNPCMRAVYHRHLGEDQREMTTALFRGLLSGHVLETVHRDDVWDPARLPDLIDSGIESVKAKGLGEGRKMTDAVVKNLPEIIGDVEERVGNYMVRLRDYYSQCELIGVELPIRFEIALEGDAIPFASHIDLAYRNPDGLLVYADFKYKDEAPTMAYLAREYQFAMYYLAFTEGLVKVGNTGTDEDWVAFNEQPISQYIDIANFRAYKRATTVTDFETGQPITYQKGDERPLRNIIKEWRYESDRERDMKYMLVEKPLIMNAGLFPVNPSPIGCHLCECKQACANLIKSHNPL